MKAIILARVSTEEQKEAGNSLPAQQERLRVYIEKNIKLALDKEFIFDESAFKEKNRTKFHEIIEYIEKQKETVALCCDKVDRLSRDFLGGLPALEKLRRNGKIELHFPSDNLVIHKDSPATDLFHYNIALSLAQYYSNSISDNVKRAIENKIRIGEWPGRPIYGYKNITISKDKRDIVVDHYKSSIVKKIFEMYATKNYSFDSIKKKVNEDYKLNFTNGNLSKIMGNTFYIGLMVFKGVTHPHKYPLFIDRDLFDKVQEVRAGFNKMRRKIKGLPAIYRSIITCTDCGCAICPEFHKGRFYYQCTESKGKHKALMITEADITEQIGAIFKKLQLPLDTAEEVTESLRSIHQGKVELRESQFRRLNQQREIFSKRLEGLVTMKLDQRITDEEYDKYQVEFRNDIADIDRRLSTLQESEDNYYLTVEHIIKLTSRAYEIFIKSNPDQKRLLINHVLTNVRLKGKTVLFDWVKPFDIIAKYNDRLLGLPL